MNEKELRAEALALEYSGLAKRGDALLVEVRFTGTDERKRHPIGTRLLIYEMTDGTRFAVSVRGSQIEGDPTWQGQHGVKDDLATPEQLAARDKGLYDPRPASGEHIATRVKLHCVRCGSHLGNVVEFEERLLFYSRSTQRWTREPRGLKCARCYAPLEGFGVDVVAIQKRVDDARHAGAARSLNIGDMH
jgi:hypothetical protein